MEHIGYSLVSDDGDELQFWGDTAGQLMGSPDFVKLPNGDDVHCPKVGDSYSGYKVVPRMLAYGAPSSVFDGTNLIVTRPAPEGPQPGTVPPVEVASALGVLVDGGDIAGIAIAFNLVGAIYLDVGQFMLLFLEPQPDADYCVLAPGFDVTEKANEYVWLASKDAADPAQFDVQIYRTGI